MSNHTVPAAAEGMSTLNRRNFLRSTAGVATLGGMVIMTTPSAAVPIADPVLTFLNQWEAAIDAFTELPDPERDAFWKSTVAPFEARAASGDVPPAETAEGAIAAIRKALSFDDMENQDANLIRSALAFLEGGA